MAFKDYPQCEQGVELLQRSLERGRLAHGYLFSGGELDDLEGVARQLAKTLNCEHPRRAANGPDRNPSRASSVWIKSAT
jgi:DNA polymerase III gamma/tau subunit